MTSQEDLQSTISRLTQTLQTLPHQLHPIPPQGSAAYAAYIDHTLLTPSATSAQIDQLCLEATHYNFCAVCVRPLWVPRAVRALRNTNIRVACVIGFPEGTYTTAEKVAEAGQAVEAGALELDMVMDWALLKRGEYAEVQADVAAVRRAAGAGGGPVRLKVILETSQLTREEIVAACVVAAGAGADFVKTSTGFCEKGATVENVRLMKAVVAAVGHGVEVKASGGVRTLRDCDAMMEAGASRIGTSNGVAIMEEGMAAAAKGGEARADGEASKDGY